MALDRKIYSLQNQRPRQVIINRLDPIRDENGPPLADDIAEEAFDEAGVVYRFFKDRFNRDSFNNLGRTIHIYVHAYRRSGSAKFYHTVGRDMVVLGDGDRRNFGPPTKAFDVVAHEITHGYLQYLCPLEYGFSDSGALSEHLSDVFGVSIRQIHLNNLNDWIVGRGFALKKDGLRNLAIPGDDRMTLECAAHISEKVGYSKQSSLYVNAGILSLAYVKARQQADDNIDVLKIWYEALQSLPRQCDFFEFASIVRLVAQRHGDDAAAVVSSSFEQVGLPIQN